MLTKIKKCSKNHSPHFNQTWYKSSLGESDTAYKIVQTKGCPFLQREIIRGNTMTASSIPILTKPDFLGRNSSLLKWKDRAHFKGYTGPISTKFDTKYYCANGIQVCSNKEPPTFLKGDNSDLVKIL